MAEMRSLDRQRTQPLRVPRTNRNHNLTVLTSLPAGKFVPIAAIPLLREDALRSGVARMAFEMQETAEILMNPVHVTVRAHLVPFLAFERFEGSMDQLNRSYKGLPQVNGGDVIPFIEKVPAGVWGENLIYKHLGLHYAEDEEVNTAYLESYNAAWNFMAKNRSPDIALRTRLQDNDLAPAFWSHSRFQHIVPNFDQAVIDGEVALNLVGGTGRLPIRGIGFSGTTSTIAENEVYLRESNGVADNYNKHVGLDAANLRMAVDSTDEATAIPQIFAELLDSGITVSLSNIDLARKTQAFARIREKYEAQDDWIIEMLMDGLTIPDQALKQPMLVAQRRATFGMQKRYASDSGNLSESAVNGMAMLELKMNIPRLSTGGVVIVTAEVVPEQLFERQRDPFLHLGSVEDLPEYLRDELDPEKVVAVKNGYIDTDHTSPEATFGYAPLNHEWNIQAPRVGGKFYRPEVDAGFDEDRQRLWAVETANPVLSEDFFIVSSIHTKPFLDTTADPFEATVIGNCVINGNTVFGGALVEATADTSNYEKIKEKAPTERLAK